MSNANFCVHEFQKILRQSKLRLLIFRKFCALATYVVVKIARARTSARFSTSPYTPVKALICHISIPGIGGYTQTILIKAGASLHFSEHHQLIQAPFVIEVRILMLCMTPIS